MKIYDISQEVFGAQVYEGDPVPQKQTVCSMDKGDLYNLTAISMCVHNGTHIDAPLHFLSNGAGVDGIALSKLVGYAAVVEYVIDDYGIGLMLLTVRSSEILDRAVHGACV